MKKQLLKFTILSLILTILMIPGLFGLKAEAETLEIAGLNGGYGVEHWQALAAEFEKTHPEVTVELTLEKNISEVLRPKIVAKRYPDIIYLSVGREGALTSTMIKENLVKDISDLLKMKVPGEEITVEEKIIPGFLDSFITNPYADGKTYLAPLFYAPAGLFYNKNLATKVDNLSWEEFFAIGEKLKGTDKSLFTYPIASYFDAFFYALVTEVGGPEFFNKAMNYDVESWQSEKMTKVFEIIAKTVSYSHPNTVAQANGANFTKNQQLILDNKAFYIPNGTWLPNEMKNAPRAEGFEWGFSALPKLGEDGDSYSYTFFEQMYIPKGADNVDLAKEFMAFMYSDKAAKIIYEKSGAVQPIKGASDLMPATDPNKLYYSIYDSGVKAAMGGFASAPPVPGVDLTSGTGILFGTINSITSGDKTVKQWQKEVVEAVKKINQARENQ